MTSLNHHLPETRTPSVLLPYGRLLQAEAKGRLQGLRRGGGSRGREGTRQRPYAPDAPARSAAGAP